MAKFIFRLQSVLGLKEKMEDMKKNEFGKAVSELASAQQKKMELEQDKALCINKLRNSIDTGIDPQKIQQYNQYIDNLKHLLARQEIYIQKCEEIVEQKRSELVEAMRERKTLEVLKENDYEEYIEEEKRSEQKIVDEIVSYRGNKA